MKNILILADVIKKHCCLIYFKSVLQGRPALPSQMTLSKMELFKTILILAEAIIKHIVALIYFYINILQDNIKSLPS